MLQSVGVTKAEIDQVLDEYDTNHDGKIDYLGERVVLLPS